MQLRTPSRALHHRGSGLKPKGGVVPQAASTGGMAFEATQSHFQPCLWVSIPEPQTTLLLTLGLALRRVGFSHF